MSSASLNLFDTQHRLLTLKLSLVLGVCAPLRIAGYCAHWRESLDDPDTKIIRPQQDYKGVWFRHFTPIGQRAAEQQQATDTVAMLTPSNACQQQFAGSSWQ
jgi:hypothetical protein